MHSKRRLLQSFSRIKDERLRELISELVKINKEFEDAANAPTAHYRRKIEAYADEYGKALDATYSDEAATPDNEEYRVSSKSLEPREFSSFITLNSITLLNFGSYYGENTVDLGPSGSRNVTAFVGSNGDGKTTLFIALNWALFGDDYRQALYAEKGRRLEDLVNRAAVKEASATSTPLTASVTLWFTVAGTNYYVTREVVASAAARGESTDVSIQPRPTKLRKLDARGNHTELLEGALISLLSPMPSRVRDFYLFDGDGINRFVARGAQEQVRLAIRRVVGIEALEKTADDLRRVSAAFRSDGRRASTGELATIQAQLEEKQNQVAAERQKMDKNRAELIALRSRIDELNAHLASAEDAQPLQQRREELEQQIRELREEEERLVYQLRELACHASTLFASDAVARLVADIDRERQMGAIPGPISKQLIADLLEMEECICGTDIAPGTTPRAVLERKLSDFASQTELAETQLALFYELASTDRWVTDKADQLDRSWKSLARVRDRLRDARTKLRDVSDKLSGIEIVDRSGWERERRERDQQRVRAEATVMTATERINELEAVIESLKGTELRLASKQEEARIASLRAAWSEAAEANVRNVFTDFAAQARRDIQRETGILWQSMLDNVAGYQVEVSPDFALGVSDNLGQQALHELAMGQQQCLALAFVLSIARVAETRPPLVIDMPFGRLGHDVAGKVAAKLPLLTEQLILFVLPGTEWNDNIREAIGPSLAREYHLVYDHESQRTRINPD
mgnify:CR=1 FL=1